MKIITNGKQIVSAGNLPEGVEVFFNGQMADLDKYYFEDGQLHLRKYPYEVIGNIIKNVPVPSTLHIAGMVYQIVESEIQLDFSTEDDYVIRLEPQDYEYLPLFGRRSVICKK